jgi:predicted  nucleic acid-binding Zn-ribbon protein
VERTSTQQETAQKKRLDSLLNRLAKIKDQNNQIESQAQSLEKQIDAILEEQEQSQKFFRRLVLLLHARALFIP